MASKNAIGLDIGSSSIKATQLKETGKGVTLLAFDMALLPPETIVDGAIINFTGLVERIRDIVQTNKLKQKKVAVSLSGHSVIIKKIALPEMTPEELEDSIQWEAEQYIPFDIKDVHVDFQILNPKAGQGQMDVLLVAAKKEVINEYSTVVREAGLDPVVVDVDTFAVFNQFELNYGVPQDETVALVNLGASTCNINVLAGGVTTFTRDITVGGNLLTDEIAKHFAVTWEEAEHMKTASESTLSTSGVLREVQRLSERVSEMLVTEIQRSLDIFAATSINADISRIFLSGGTAQQGALVQAMERRLGTGVELVNPFKNIFVDPNRFDITLLQRIAPVAAVSVGLALRRSSDR